MGSLRVCFVAALAACGGNSGGGATTTTPRPPDPPEVPQCGSDAGSATTGTVGGVVTDAHTGEALPGATLVLTAPAMANAQAVITDDSGAYKVSLPPGAYLATFYYLDQTLERQGVPVRAGCYTPLYQRIDTSKNSGEVIRVL